VSLSGLSGTRRQQLRARLREEELSFEALRREFEMSVRLLEDDLRHLERSLRHAPEKLVVTPARCRDCDFRFRTKHFHTPSRCPRCRSEAVAPVRLRVGVA
jgi:predicted Zn-ribbon and HTH transcriptional regulator